MAKKIINHIPSLSSLLLSGLVLTTATSCGDCNGNKTKTATETQTEAEATEQTSEKKETSTQKEGEKGEVAKAFANVNKQELEAVTKMFDVIVSKKKNLEQLRNTVYCVAPEKIESAPKPEAIKIGYDICRGFRQAPFYPGSTLEALGNLEWNSRLSHKEATALAVNELARLFKPLVEVAEGFEEMRQSADFGLVDVFSKKLSELQQQSDNILKLSTTFAVANDSGAFKTSKEFLAFFGDDSNRGASTLLRRSLGPVHINCVALSEDEREQRTREINQGWKVEGMDRSLPQVDELPQTANGTLEDLTFAQLLFTIFYSESKEPQGEGDIFFIKRPDSSSRKPIAGFKVIKEGFGNLVKEKVTLKDEEFAAWLGSRINGDKVLKTLFPIANVSSDTECGKLIAAVAKLRTNNEKGGNSNTPLTEQLVAPLLGLVGNLFPNVSLNMNTKSINLKGQTKLKDANGVDQDSLPVNNFTELLDAINQNKDHFGDPARVDEYPFEQRLGLQLVNNITAAITNKNELNSFLTGIETTIEDCLGGVILKSEGQGREFKPTAYTIAFKKALKDLSTAVVERLKGKSVTLKGLQDITDNGFSVEKYKTFIKTCIEEERRILALPLLLKTLLNIPGQNQADEYVGTLNVPGLTNAQAAQLNQIRKEYQQKNATMKPAPAAAG